MVWTGMAGDGYWGGSVLLLSPNTSLELSVPPLPFPKSPPSSGEDPGAPRFGAARAQLWGFCPSRPDPATPKLRAVQGAATPKPGETEPQRDGAWTPQNLQRQRLTPQNQERQSRESQRAAASTAELGEPPGAGASARPGGSLAPGQTLGEYLAPPEPRGIPFLFPFPFGVPGWP